MNKICVLFCLFFFTTPCLHAQEGKPLPGKDDKVNLYDRNGKKHGMWVFQTPARRGEAATSEFGSFEHGKKLGVWYKINKAGDFVSMESFRNDLLDGDVKYYDEKGRLYCTGRYLALNPHKEYDTIVVMDPISHEESYKVIASEYGSVKHGTWKYYDPLNGRLLKEEEYQVDEIVYKQAYVMAVDSSLMKKRENSLPHRKRTKSSVPAGRKVTYAN